MLVRKKTKRDDERRRVRVRLRLPIFGRPAVQGIPIQSLQQALTSALRVSVPGKSGQPGKRSRQIGMLPAADVADRLPLADRVGNRKASRYMQLPSGSTLCFESDDDASPAGGLSEAAPSSRATHMSHGQGEISLDSLVQSHAELVFFRVGDAKPSKKKRPLGAADDLQAHDVAIRVYKGQYVQSNKEDHGFQACVRASEFSEIPLLRMFDTTSPTDIIQNMYQWQIQPQSELSLKNGEIRIARTRRMFECREAVPFRLSDLNVSRGIKPTQFELYMLLGNRGWVRSYWDDKQRLLKELKISSADKRYFHIGFFYFVVILNIDEFTAAEGGNDIHVVHGQCETYYRTVLELTQSGRRDEASRVPPNKAAAWYRTGAGHVCPK